MYHIVIYKHMHRLTISMYAFKDSLIRGFKIVIFLKIEDIYLS